MGVHFVGDGVNISSDLSSIRLFKVLAAISVLGFDADVFLSIVQLPSYLSQFQDHGDQRRHTMSTETKVIPDGFQVLRPMLA